MKNCFFNKLSLKALLTATATMAIAIPTITGIDIFADSDFSALNLPSLKTNDVLQETPEDIGLLVTADDVHNFVGTRDLTTYCEGTGFAAEEVNEFRFVYEANGSVLGRTFWTWDDALLTWKAYSSHQRFAGKCLYKTADDDDFREWPTSINANNPDIINGLSRTAFSEFSVRVMNSNRVFTRYNGNGPWYGTPVTRSAYVVNGKQVNKEPVSMVYYAPTSINIETDSDIDYHNFNLPLVSFVDYNHALVAGSGPQQADQTAIKWSLQDQPDGVNIDPQSGIITWSDTLAAGEYNFTTRCESSLQLTDGSSYGDEINTTKPFKLTVYRAPESMDITGSGNITTKLGLAGTEKYDYTFSPIQQDYMVSDVIWSIESTDGKLTNENISINQDGTLHYYQNIPMGTYNINVKATSVVNQNNTKSAIFPVALTVTEPDPISVSIRPHLNLSSLEGHGGHYQYSATVLPEEAKKTLNWSVRVTNGNLNQNQISIDNQGNLTWTNDIEVGQYTLAVTATSTVLETVSDTLNNITLDINKIQPENVRITAGDRNITTKVGVSGTNNSYNAVVEPDGANQFVTWDLQLLDESNPYADDIYLADDEKGIVAWSDQLPVGQYQFNLVATSDEDELIKSAPYLVNLIVKDNTSGLDWWIFLAAGLGGAIVIIAIVTIIVVVIKKKKK